MKQPETWTEDFTIRFHEVNARGNLSILSICHFLQSAASNHARALGISVDDLRSTGHMWVLARLKLHLDDYPTGNEHIRIHTWPAGFDRLFALREFRIFDGNGGLCGLAGSAWLILDIQRRRPVRLEPFGEGIHQISLREDISAGMEKLPEIGDPIFTREFRVRYHDMDVNRHVNNVSYVEWALESLPASILTTGSLLDLDLSFVGEAHQGDTVISQAQPVNDTGTSFIHELFSKNSGESLFRARSVWAEEAGKRKGISTK